MHSRKKACTFVLIESFSKQQNRKTVTPNKEIIPLDCFSDKGVRCTISEMADLEVPVQTDYRHGDEAATAKEEARPTIETAAFPAK